LLRTAVVEPNDLAGRSCASFLPEHHITKALKIAFDSAGVPFDPKFQMQNGATEYEIIGSGAAFGVFSPLTAWIHRRIWSDNRSLEFPRFSPKSPYHFSIITPKRRPLLRAALAFVEALESAVSRTLSETRKLIDDVSY
jgi:DNA-binding transcriptional LysR family regulator